MVLSTSQSKHFVLLKCYYSTEGEVFQIKKSSHSKKVAKKLRERARKEKHREEVAKLVKDTVKHTSESGTKGM